MADWQPIETAEETDDTHIDVWVVRTYSNGAKDEGQRVPDVRFKDGAWCEYDPHYGEWMTVEEHGSEAYDTITHWMARPAPPRKRETSTPNSLTPIVNTEES